MVASWASRVRRNDEKVHRPMAMGTARRGTATGPDPHAHEADEQAEQPEGEVVGQGGAHVPPDDGQGLAVAEGDVGEDEAHVHDAEGGGGDQGHGQAGHAVPVGDELEHRGGGHRGQEELRAVVGHHAEAPGPEVLEVEARGGAHQTGAEEQLVSPRRRGWRCRP